MGIGVNTRTSFSLLFPPILDEFGWSRGTIAATFSIGFVASTLMTPIIGALMDRFGPRLVLPLGAILTACGLMGSTFATLPWHFYLTLGALVVGGTVFMSYIGHTLFLPNWFQRRRGLALGIAFSGVGIGSIIMLPWMQYSIQTIGWRESVWILAVVILVVLIPLNVLFQRNRPEDMGLRPDGAAAPMPSGGAPSRLDDGIVDRAWTATEWTLPRAIRTSRFWWLMLSFSSGLYAWYAVQVHQTRYLIDIGISAETAALALGLVGLTGIGGQIAIGHFSDRVGREWAWSLALMGFFLTYVCLFVLDTWPSQWLMYAMVGAQGFLGYGLASVFGAVPAELFAGKRYGIIFGVIGAASGAGAALGPWATGFFFDIWNGYIEAFLVAMGMCVISIAAMWIAGPRKVRLVAGRIKSGNSE
ncbi:MAG: MFS transporter [Rhodospirillales bacterium]|nr:MFS transporter [Rhodospirillales bacterium]